MKGNNCLITCEKVLVLVLHCPLTMREVSFDSHEYFQRYALDKLLLQKMGKEITP